jgi:large subunit ribosomal protein L25
MERIDLTANLRQETGKGPSHRYRQQGLVPAVFYGRATDTLPLTVDLAEIKRVIRGHHGGENLLFNLRVEGKADLDPQVAMMRDVQIDPITREIIHIDFHKINLTEKVEVAVPIELVGKAEGVKLGGILQQIERELHVRCLPMQIPNSIDVDVTSLKIGDSLHVRDLSLAEGIEILTIGDHTLVTVVGARAEIEAPAGEEAEAGEEEKKAKEPESE